MVDNKGWLLRAAFCVLGGVGNGYHCLYGLLYAGITEFINDEVGKLKPFQMMDVSVE